MRNVDANYVVRSAYSPVGDFGTNDVFEARVYYVWPVPVFTEDKSDPSIGGVHSRLCRDVPVKLKEGR